MKNADPLIDEVRAVRRALSERFGNDLDDLCDHLQTIERRYEGRVAKELAPHERTGRGSRALPPD
jgi:hypothetical protein